MSHTIETVKRDLPQVQLKLKSGEIVTANVSGRKSPFAFVWYKDNHQGWSFCWSAIVVSLNSGKPLSI